MKKISLLVVGLCFWLPGWVAALTIEITQGIEGAIPIAVVPFDAGNNRYTPPQDVAQIVAADLARSGRFKPAEERDLTKPARCASRTGVLSVSRTW